MRLTTKLVLAALPMMLAACGGDSTPATDESAAASGEILEGSVSDAMIATDEVRSQAPLMAADPAEAGSGEGATAAPEGEGEGDAAPAEEEAPATTDPAE